MGFVDNVKYLKFRIWLAKIENMCQNMLNRKNKECHHGH